MKYHTRLTLKIYWQHAMKYRLIVFLVAFSVIAASTLSVAAPLYFKIFFDLLISPGVKAEITGGLISILIIIALLELIQWFFWRLATYGAAYLESNAIADLANTCFKYLHQHSFGYFNNNFVGSLVKRVNRFTRAFEGISDRIIFELLGIFVNIIIIAAVLVYKNFYLGLVVIIWLILFLIFNWFFTRYKLKYDIASADADTRSTGVLADTITNNANIKLFCGYKREVDRFGRVNEEARALKLKSWNLSNLFEAIQGLLMVILEIGVIYLGIRLWEAGLFTVGDFVLLQSYVLIVFIRIWGVGRIIRHIYQNLADAEEMTVILDSPHEIKDNPKAKDLIVKKGAVEFNKVEFYYHQTRRIIKDFNLTIKPGERIALVGPSGAGKSTIVKLLLRMHEATKGKILIDGQKINQVKQESLWRGISLVPQEPILFHRTLMENIRYGQPEATNNEVVDAAKLAHCHEFIINFPDAYSTYVGERGIKLSGGERQRVAIARAILRNAPILVLDEATSSLDSESEALIQKGLENLMKGKTVIVIAHRLSTIMKMDRIIVIDGGKIKEQGSHKELLGKKEGLYKRLWKVQAGGFLAT